MSNVDRCSQHDCDEPSAFRYTWPGNDEAGVCAQHVGRIRRGALALAFHIQIIPLPGDSVCQRCCGCGQIADSDEGEPWVYWEELPPGADVAVRMGLVKPIPCPDCTNTVKIGNLDTVDRIRWRWSHATRGPWDHKVGGMRTSDLPTHYIAYLGADANGRHSVHSENYVGDWNAGVDAEAIAHAPEDIAFLLAEVDRLRESLATIAKEVMEPVELPPECPSLTERICGSIRELVAQRTDARSGEHNMTTRVSELESATETPTALDLKDEA